MVVWGEIGVYSWVQWLDLKPLAVGSNMMRSRGAGRAKTTKKTKATMRGGTATQTVRDALMLRSGASWGKPVRGGGGGGD